MNQDALKKHHFWILSGLAPLFVLGAVVLIWSDVGAEVEKEQKELKKAEDALKVNPKGKTILEELDKQKVTLGLKRTELWKFNSDRQYSLPILMDANNREIRFYEWPRDGQGQIAELEKHYPNFGDPIGLGKNKDDLDVLDVFKTPAVYEAAYDRAAKAIRPTTFATGSWKGVLRYVSDWTNRRPTSQQIWLALEDLWIQRGLLAPVKQVNDAAAQFALLGNGSDPLKRKFASRVWELDLDASDRKIVRMKLRNKTDRLQLLGVGNTMRLKLWLSKAPTARPIEVRIEGEFVKAAPSPESTLEIRPVRNLHRIDLPPDEVQEIVRVEQILDERTVPIRQIGNIALNYKDARNNLAELKPPLQSTFNVETPASGTGAPTVPGPGGQPPRPPIPGGEEVPGQPGKPGAVGARTGDPKVVLDGNKNRYLAVSEQVRRMPVAIVLIVDQMFVQDALVAYTNSPMRFQITQSHWRRFRGSLGSSTQPTDQPMGEEGQPTPTPFPMGSPGFPGYPGSVPGPNSAVAESQVTSGLVELTIYGIVTLYERYDEKVAAGTPATK